jgi:hypothetical protein
MRHRSTLRAVGPALLLWIAAPAAPSSAQQAATDSLRLEIRRLAALVDSLRSEVDRLRASGEEKEADDALAQLRAAAEAAAATAGPPPASQEEPQQFVGRQRSLQALNPEISMTGDLFASINPDDTDSENFIPREFELSIVSSLDPFSRAKVFISRHQEGGDLGLFPGGAGEATSPEEDGHGGGFAVEEGYVEWVGLPGGLGLKLGRFFQQFGQLNRWHSHALPFQNRSLPHQAFIGEEQLAQTGASVHWLLPFGGAVGTYDATFEVTTSDNASLFGASGRPSVLGTLNGFWQLSEATDLDVALSWVNGSYEDDTNLLDRNLFGAEASFTWRPPRASLYKGVNVRAGAMVLDGLLPALDGAAGSDRAKGFWSMAEVRLGRSWLAGGRYDWTENPLDTEDTAWQAGPTLTWWQSEYVRVRAEYDLLGQTQLDNQGRLFLQVTLAMGPHKHETY